MDTPGLQTPVSPLPQAPPPAASPVQPETPQVTPPSSPVKKTLKKKGFKIVGGLLMIALIVGGVFYTVDQFTLQQQIIESQGKTAKKAPKDVDKKEDCGGASNGGWQVWRGGECKITGISGDPRKGKNTEDPMAKQASTKTACEKDTGYTWCDGTDARGNSYGFCNTTGTACYQKAIELGYLMTKGNCAGVGSADYVWYCKGKNADFDSGCQGTDNLPGGAGWDGENKTIKGRFCGVIQVDDKDGGFCSAKDISGCDQEGAAAEVLPSPSPSPGVSPSPSPSPSPSLTLSCVDLTKDIATPKLNDTVTFTCQGVNFSSAAPVAQFRTSFNGGTTFNNPTSPKPINLTTGKATEQFIVSQTGDWEVQCRVCTDNTTTTCAAWGKAL